MESGNVSIVGWRSSKAQTFSSPPLSFDAARASPNTENSGVARSFNKVCRYVRGRRREIPCVRVTSNHGLDLEFRGRRGRRGGKKTLARHSIHGF